MFLPGMHYQDAAWEVCKKSLGLAVLQAVHGIGLPRLLDTGAITPKLVLLNTSISHTLLRMQGYLQQTRNNLDCDAYDMATQLLWAFAPFVPVVPFVAADPPLAAGSADTTDPVAPYCQTWLNKLAKACPAGKHALADSIVRKISNDVLADLRDEMDVQAFMAATGEPMNVNRLHNLRKVDHASHRVREVLLNWRAHGDYASFILGYEVLAEPIEARLLAKGGRCKPEWLLRWSEHHQHIHPTGKPGPFHTRSKQFTASIHNLTHMLQLLDPLTGTWAGWQNSAPLDDWLPHLREIEAAVVDDSHHPTRIVSDDAEPPPMVPDEDEIDDEVAHLHMAEVPDLDFNLTGEVGMAWDSLADEEELQAEQAFAAIPLQEHDEPDNLEQAASDPWQDVWQKLAIWPLPIQVAILRDLGEELAPTFLQEALEQMDIFQKWGWPPPKPGDAASKLAKRLNNVELMRHMPAPPPSASAFRQQLASAKQWFLAQAAARLGGRAK
ncbi:MAG: hypothetical protein RL748_1343 [Pseudomonadota bacterium]|jgi:hypothetical protein